MKIRQTGFTLIELLITIVVVAILASIAIPSYNNSVNKARRADAQSALSGFASALERYFTENGTYLGAAGTQGTPADTGSPWIFATQAPIDGSSKFYNLTIEAATAGSYRIRATPINGHVGDGYLELDSFGVKRWDQNDDGDTADAGETDWS